MESFDALLKVVIIGDSCVGKTCLILRYTQDIFRENFLSTIGEGETRHVRWYEGRQSEPGGGTMKFMVVRNIHWHI